MMCSKSGSHTSSLQHETRWRNWGLRARLGNGLSTASRPSCSSMTEISQCEVWRPSKLGRSETSCYTCRRKSCRRYTLIGSVVISSNPWDDSRAGCRTDTRQRARKRVYVSLIFLPFTEVRSHVCSAGGKGTDEDLRTFD